MSWRSARPVLLGAPLALAAWFAVMLGLTLVQPAGEPVAVYAIGGVGRTIDIVAVADGYILEVTNGTVIAVAKDEGFVPRLYGAGAVMVIAAGVAGCVVAPDEAFSRPSV